MKRSVSTTKKCNREKNDEQGRGTNLDTKQQDLAQHFFIQWPLHDLTFQGQRKESRFSMGRKLNTRL